MKTKISYLDRAELIPTRKDVDLCGECRSKGLNLCDVDEICQIRLANALGKRHSEVSVFVDYAKKKGLIDVRYIKAKGARPKKFIKITDKGEMFFGLMK
jgi:predicted transcriptional regulator